MTQLSGFLSDTRFGGEGALRGLYADFLDEAAGLPGLSALGEHSADYLQLAQLWDEFAELVDPDQVRLFYTTSIYLALLKEVQSHRLCEPTFGGLQA